MAFKIESIEEVKRISSRLEERKVEMTNISADANNSLESLKSLIICDGISETMDKLSSAITTNSNTVNELFGTISAFINTQMAEYEAANEAGASNIAATEQNLNDIVL